ncbi:MAG: UPF0280 family protein [Desulfobacterales bacterium]|nr:UPF0280 family protein [Desulfobacterales bacterium]
MYKERAYRNLVHQDNLVSFRVAVKETDLFVYAAKHFEELTRELVLKHRGYVEAYIEENQDFAKTLDSYRINGPAPIIIKDMAAASEKTGVGPMAAVAGAIAEHVGKDLLSYTDEVVVENGGDIFIKTDSPVTVGIFAGRSPFSMRIGLRVATKGKPVSICTSSGTIGHSLSLGKADAVCVVSESCSLADAAATSICNHVVSKTDIQKAIEFGKNIDGVTGLVIIMGDKIGLYGKVEIVPLKAKKG